MATVPNTTYPSTMRQSPSLFPIRPSLELPRLPLHTDVRSQWLRQIPDAHKRPSLLRQRPRAKALHLLNYVPSILFSTTMLVPASFRQVRASLRRSNSPLHTRTSANQHVPRFLLLQLPIHDSLPTSRSIRVCSQPRHPWQIRITGFRSHLITLYIVFRTFFFDNGHLPLFGIPHLVKHNHSSRYFTFVPRFTYTGSLLDFLFFFRGCASLLN